jgi:hypothetical protein
MQQGWIKIHRQFLDWEWYDDNNTKIVFLHLLLKANHKPKKYRGMELKAGSILTGRDLLSFQTGLSVMQIRTALTKLKSTNEITTKTSSQGSIIQIVNYTKYQIVTNELTKEQPASNQQVTTNKNDKNVKNENKLEIIQADLLEWFNSEFKRKFTIINKTKLKARLKTFEIEKIKIAIKNAYSDKYHIENNFKYLTPEYFFRNDENIDKWLNVKNVNNSKNYKPKKYGN